MFKEINDVKEVCKIIILRSDKIKNLSTEMESLMDEVKSKTSQEEAANITLAIRKELTNLSDSDRREKVIWIILKLKRIMFIYCE